MHVHSKFKDSNKSCHSRELVFQIQVSSLHQLGFFNTSVVVAGFVQVQMPNEPGNTSINHKRLKLSYRLFHDKYSVNKVAFVLSYGRKRVTWYRSATYGYGSFKN